MRPLPANLKRDGFNLALVERAGNVAIYRQSKHGQSWERFEVIKIRSHRDKLIKGRPCPAAEVYPSSLRVSGETERARDGRTRGGRDRAPSHSLQPLVLPPLGRIKNIFRKGVDNAC